MAKTEEAEPDLSQATPNQILKQLLAFQDETRKNFSSQVSDSQHDYELLQQVNQNVTSLTGKVENLVSVVKKLTETNHQDNKETVATVETKVDEIKEVVEPKRFIIKEVPHFSFRLWWQSIFKKRR